MNIEKRLEQYGWNGKFFLLTRDHTVEITTVGGGYDDVPIAEKGCLFHYANQCLPWRDDLSNEEVDEFGRNFLDRTFIRLCMTLHDDVHLSKPPKVFKSLVTRKDGDRYMVRVRYDDVDLEMEVVEMFHYFTEKEGKREYTTDE